MELLEDIQCSKMKIDTGADQTVVSADLVDPKFFTGKTMKLVGFNRAKEEVPMARVWLSMGDFLFQQDVAVLKVAMDPVLLGTELGIIEELMDLSKFQRKEDEQMEKSPVYQMSGG